MWKPGHQTGKEVTSEETLGKECASWEELEVITSPRPPCTALPLSLKLQCNPVPLPNPSCFSCASCGVMKGRTMSMFSEAKMVERIIPISKHCFQKTGHPISSQKQRKKHCDTIGSQEQKNLGFMSLSMQVNLHLSDISRDTLRKAASQESHQCDTICRNVGRKVNEVLF